MWLAKPLPFCECGHLEAAHHSDGCHWCGCDAFKAQEPPDEMTEEQRKEWFG